MRLLRSIFITFVFIMQIPNAYAKIKHISLNERMFELGKIPMLKINIVADMQDIANLEFILVQQNSEERLVVQQQNQFMLFAMGLEKVYDINAKLVVHYSAPIGEIKLFNKNDIDKTNIKLSSQPLQTKQNSSPCMLDYDGNKTLWRLAKDYSVIWETNIYSAMLAIFYANQRWFNQGRINALRKDAKLSCPTEELLNQYRDNENAKRHFNSIN
ncbi:hypothetical protein AYI92_06645 [Shewanella xiamenensis]|uniref:hypothetical protein n=1 Tax=Shewanella xiamenensis TaxID=332186 RepID=UPI001DEFE85C|nr:hypothetical protein [Shewanella xiamenensis]TVL21236.1 hypothetical protein AYI90_07030 [Shewanella xiamenensis]TVL21414.1 hypothetical protein AYI91_07840 [Shewanella xiamenensis]TVL27445.1 hypothetical protein AYI92_06645 [Shewanella xiamenensis]TVL34992.1 hypothetical protein AYI93_07260 [Shewanella xiamenensis]TVL36233.1 hypothetical protein AYI95_00290 [Shewanella xiamenensis]